MDIVKRGLCLDLDGTLLASVQESRKRIIRIAQKCDMPIAPDIEEKIISGWRKSYGKSGFISSVWPEETPEKIKAFTRAWEDFDTAESCSLFPNTRDTLVMLRQYFYLSILTNRSSQSANFQIRKNNIMLLFNFIVTPDWINVRKPDPKAMNPVFEKYEQLGILRKDIIFVGDTIEGDWQLAKTLNMEFYAVLAGEIHTKEEFLAAGVPEDHIIRFVSELPAILIPEP